MKKISVIFFASALLISWGGHLTEVMAEELPVKEKMFQDGRFVTGGVGKNERNALEKLAEEYDLKLVFAKSNGNYLANVPFKILNSKGESFLEAVADGPWVLVDLPSGYYTVTAELHGTKRSRNVVVDSGYNIYMFHWKS